MEMLITAQYPQYPSEEIPNTAQYRQYQYVNI